MGAEKANPIYSNDSDKGDSAFRINCMSNRAELIVGGQTLSVSNLDKVLYPKAGFTKGQVIDYYIRIAPRSSLI